MSTSGGFRHPVLRPGWVDASHRRLALGDLPLEGGGVIHDFELSYVMHGTPDAAGSNVVLVTVSLSGSHHTGCYS